MDADERQRTPTSADGVWEKVEVWRGDITLLDADFIVNAANSALLGCFQPQHRCIDNVIHARAGPRLRGACAEAVRRAGGVPEPVGSCRVTPGFALPARYVLHTVGPDLTPRGRAPTEHEREQLRSCYRSCLDAVVDAGIVGPTTVAFPCISTGVFGYPKNLAAEAAIEAVLEWQDAHPEHRDRVKIIFNTFLSDDHEIYRSLLSTRFNCVVEQGQSSELEALKDAAAALHAADYLLISGGSGLSASAGLDYTSEAVFKTTHPAMHRRGFRYMYQFIGFRDWTPELQWGYLFMQTLKARFNWKPTAPTYHHLRTEEGFNGHVPLTLQETLDATSM